MPVFKTGRVTAIAESNAGIVRVVVNVDDNEIEAAGFPSMLGPVDVGDRVIVNTTGIELALGTGGEGFVLWNLDGAGPGGPGPGHIMKMRYTPWQTEVLSAEAPESPYHDVLAHATDIGGMPVVACGLHSQIAAVAAGIKATRGGARVGFLMTDAAALPLAWSRLVERLRDTGLVDVTVTAGHAFGGDLEAVNIFSGLAAMRHACGVDVTITAMGPGVVGTSTALGFTAIEQGQALDAATALAGRAVACLRISFADERSRHSGVSHHAITALVVAARERATVVVPELGDTAARKVRAALEEAGVQQRHDIVSADGAAGLELLQDRDVTVTSMGRSLEQDRELFLAASAAGHVAAEML